MKFLRMVATLAVPLMWLTLAGCGSGSDSSRIADDPFVATDDSSPTTSTGSGTVLNYNLALSTTAADGVSSTVGANSTVIATAILKDSNGNTVANQPVRFETVLPDSPVTINPAVVTTDSSGKAINFLTANSITSSAVDVIIKASTTISGQFVTSVGIFKILRSQGNIIKFMTSKVATDPDGTLNKLAVTVENRPADDPPKQILQLVPFQLLDNNGIPRTRVPVSVSVYSQIGNCPVFIDSPETVTKTVTTDDSGLGIFNAGVTVAMPPVGSENACSVIYKAEAADLNDDSKLIYSYGGFLAVLKNVLK